MTPELLADYLWASIGAALLAVCLLSFFEARRSVRARRALERLLEDLPPR